MSSANKKAFFEDLVFEVCGDVNEPAEDSFLFAENLHLKPHARVLDVGTGSGLLGILAAAKGAREVVAIDINPHAIKCAKQNAHKNGVSNKMRFVQGDLFTPLTETALFDLILFNAPYLPSEEGEDGTWLGRAWAGGATGREVIDRFIAQAPHHLRRNGVIFLMQSNLATIRETIEKFAAQKMHAASVAHLDLPFFETLHLLEAIF
jgi:release factor glutamine methyltransferase